jgi:hypothetical protein
MTANARIYQGFNSVFSLQPLITVLRKMIAEGKPGVKKLYTDLLLEVEQVPDLLEPIEDTSVLHKHAELVDALLSTIFTPSTSANQGMYAIAYPFSNETVYATTAFKDQFLKDNSSEIVIPDKSTAVNITKASLSLAYNVILRKFYSLDLPLVASSVHPFVDEEVNLTKYLELKLNAQFVDVQLQNNFQLPSGFSPQRSLDIDELKETFPLENFRFEGLVVIDVTDVTSEQVVAEIKNVLLNINSFNDATVYDKLQQYIQTYLGIDNVMIGITPFFKINDYYLFAEGSFHSSILFRNQYVRQHKAEITKLCQRIFNEKSQPLLYHDLSENKKYNNPILKYYVEQGAKSLIICPLVCDDGDLIGLLEIMSDEPDKLRFKHLLKLRSSIELFTLTLEKNLESMELLVDKTIKEHFTAIQPAVEWKFTEAAFNYLQYKTDEEDATKMALIRFEDVYPLYAAIDIRNSSVQRGQAIQSDLLEQLESVRNVLDTAVKIVPFPLLKEISFKINKYIATISENLLSDDELMIYEFLDKDIFSLFQHLSSTKPELKKIIDTYFNSLDKEKKIIYHHRKNYEDSITRINDLLERFIDTEQQNAQAIYPHYFERYVTDGLEFNIYVGQALAPNHPFNEVYVKNLKLWQLTTLTKAARLTSALEKRLAMPLQTTQLILAHSIPLNISFRSKERKFDVDGAYNIRYEIIKKRIDKVHLKDSEERLTQPGTIAIVYSQQKELNEYLEYVEFLQNENLLMDEIEHLELEDTQGISGLKAVRIPINLTNTEGLLTRKTQQELQQK